MPQVECGFKGTPGLLVHFGPSIGVLIGFDPSFRPNVTPAPNLPVQEYPALIDTGATESCIDSAVAQALNLPIIDERMMAGVHRQFKVNVHLAQIRIPSLQYTIYGNFCGVHLHAGGQSHSSLLGRTFLSKMTMIYKGDTESVLLSYP